MGVSEKSSKTTKSTFSIFSFKPKPIPEIEGLPLIEYLRYKAEELGVVGSTSEDFLETHLSSKIDHEAWNVCKVIGQGAFSKVLLVKHKNEKEEKYYAMKSIRKSNILAKRFIEGTVREREILLSMKHPFILDLHYAF